MRMWKLSPREREIESMKILKRAFQGEKFEIIGRDYDLTADGVMRVIRRMMERGELDSLVDELGVSDETRQSQRDEDYLEGYGDALVS